MRSSEEKSRYREGNQDNDYPVGEKQQNVYPAPETEEQKDRSVPLIEERKDRSVPLMRHPAGNVTIGPSFSGLEAPRNGNFWRQPSQPNKKNGTRSKVLQNGQIPVVQPPPDGENEMNTEGKFPYTRRKPVKVRYAPARLNNPLIAIEPIKIFYCCTQTKQDVKLLNELEMQLMSLKRVDPITLRLNHDILSKRRIWSNIENQGFQSADLILLMISPDLTGANYYYKQILNALELFRLNMVWVIPILLRPTSGVSRMPFGELQVLPRNGRALNEQRNRGAAVVEIVEEISKVVAKLLKRKQEYAFLAPSTPRKFPKFTRIIGPSCITCGARNPLGTISCDNCGDILLSSISKNSQIVHLPDIYKDDVTEIPFFLNSVIPDQREMSISQKTEEDWIKEGDMYREFKQYLQAIAAYSCAIQLNRRLASAYFNRGLAYLALHQKRHALADSDYAHQLIHHALQNGAEMSRNVE